jgi:plastocyanin
MPRFSRLRPKYLALGFMVSGSLLSGAAPMAALARSPTVYAIGVDNAGPPGHVFEYVDFFPRDGVKVAAGDVLDFSWNTSAQDGAHTATFLTKGMGLPPLAIPEPNGDEAGLQFNPDLLAPSDPTCGSSATNPCVFDGTKVVNSGFIFNSNPTPPYASDFYVALDSKLLQGGSSVEVPFVCEVHPGMAGSVTLVSDARETTTIQTAQDKAASQLADDTKGALNAEKSANNKPFVGHNLNGTSDITVTAGTATSFVEVVEMLPNVVTIKQGDTVNWVTKTIRDPHTVTFPRGPGSDSVDPIPAFCETQSGDTRPSADGPPCANPASFELHLLPQPLGTQVISDPSTIGSSGVIGSTKDGFPDNFSFTFPNAGTFDYMCRIHDHMVGTIVVRP